MTLIFGKHPVVRLQKQSSLKSISHYLPRQWSRSQNRSCECVCVCVSTLLAKPFDLLVQALKCLDYIHHNKRTVWQKGCTMGDAGGTSMLRRFHFKNFWSGSPFGIQHSEIPQFICHIQSVPQSETQIGWVAGHYSCMQVSDDRQDWYIFLIPLELHISYVSLIWSQ